MKNLRHGVGIRTLLLVGALATGAGATAIQWNSALIGPVHTDSSGAPLDESWSFYLGAFVNAPMGWTPNAGNTAEWHQYWVTADVSGFFPAGAAAGRFTSRHEVTQIIPQFTLGYIWGTNRAHPDAEWILMTNPTPDATGWYWPLANPIDFTLLNWTPDAATVAIVGTVTPTPPPAPPVYEMQTAVVTNSLPPLLSGPNWLEIHFTEDEIMNQQATLSGWSADPNGNGRPNILEFAYNADPREPQFDHEPTSGTMEDSGFDFLTLTITKDPNVDLDYEGEVSFDLVSWFSGGALVSVEPSSSPTELILRNLTPIGAGVSLCGMRVEVTLP